MHIIRHYIVLMRLELKMLCIYHVYISFFFFYDALRNKLSLSPERTEVLVGGWWINALEKKFQHSNSNLWHSFFWFGKTYSNTLASSVTPSSEKWNWRWTMTPQGSILRKYISTVQPSLETKWVLLGYWLIINKKFVLNLYISSTSVSHLSFKPHQQLCFDHYNWHIIKKKNYIINN